MLSNGLPRDSLRFLVELQRLSAQDQARIINLIMLFARAPDEVKECAYAMIMQLKEMVPEGNDVVARGVDDIIDYIQTSPAPRPRRAKTSADQLS